jgi:hypothetical protein
VLVVKTQWELYQALELIPESVSPPKTSWFAWLTAPMRRPFANVFTRELSPRHQVLLFKRCLAITNAQTLDCSPLKSLQMTDQYPSLDEPSTDEILAEQLQFNAQQWLNRGGEPWWTWYDY